MSEKLRITCYLYQSITNHMLSIAAAENHMLLACQISEKSHAIRYLSLLSIGYSYHC